MKTKALIILAAILTVSITVFAASSKWEKVNDSCENCKITDYEYKCGKCDSSMSWKAKTEGKYLIYTFTCNSESCKHKCVYKTKY